MNSSKTWKSGEMCRTTGLYQCRGCQLGGRETVRELPAGTILPMCDACPDKDATYRLVKVTEAVATGS